MDEKLREELNEILRNVWLAGHKITDVAELKSFEKAMSIALSDGWDAESEDSIDFMDTW